MDNPTIFVIVGSTGDLATRKLLPALKALVEQNALPSVFHLICVTRQSGVSAPTFLPSDMVTVLQMDSTDHTQYHRLTECVEDIERKWGTEAQRILYLAVPPSASHTILHNLDSFDLVRTKVVIEKPFGVDRESAEALIQMIERHVLPQHVYLMDHYVAKEFAEQVGEFHIVHKELIDAQRIARVDIIASESIGVEGRANFYEQTGALRDFVQNHLLELAALLIGGSDPMERTAALGDLQVVHARRGQYEGYRHDVGNPASTTETFVALHLRCGTEHWQDIPITLATGKALATKETSVRVSLTTGDTIVYTDTAAHTTYERIIQGVIRGDRTKFVSSSEVLEAWRVVAPVQRQWKQTSDDLVIYPKGTALKTLL